MTGFNSCSHTSPTNSIRITLNFYLYDYILFSLPELECVNGNSKKEQINKLIQHKLQNIIVTFYHLKIIRCFFFNEKEALNDEINRRPTRIF